LLDEATCRRSAPTSCKRGHSRICAAWSGPMALIFWPLSHWAARSFCLWIVLCISIHIFSRYCLQDPMYLFKVLYLGLQEILINYLKMGLIKLLFSFSPIHCNLHTRDQKRVNNSVLFIYWVGKYDNKMQNWWLIMQHSPLPRNWWALDLISSNYNSMTRSWRNTAGNNVGNCCTCPGSYAPRQREAKGGWNW